MDPNEIRYRLISTLLQAAGPLSFAELVAGARGDVPASTTEITEEEILPVLKELVSENLVVEIGRTHDLHSNRLAARSTTEPAPQYCWAARWEKEAERLAASSKQKLQSIVELTVARERKLDIDSEPVLAFHNYVIDDYKPPSDKRLLVFLQCSVRRPFSSSPSHGSMRRAIAVATGYDPSPSRDFRNCPVHVVVLASKIGPVPYELEDVYPASVRGGGVKHFDRSYYMRVKPILAERMAEYVITHKGSYDHITTFTESRYGEVMEEAREIVLDCCGEDLYFPILPVMGGPQVLRMGKSMPRTYWERFWIQLYLEIVNWLDPAQQSQAEARLEELDVRYYAG